MRPYDFTVALILLTSSFVSAFTLPETDVATFQPEQRDDSNFEELWKRKGGGGGGGKGGGGGTGSSGRFGSGGDYSVHLAHALPQVPVQALDHRDPAAHRKAHIYLQILNDS
jgi:hypothetical protein